MVASFLIIAVFLVLLIVIKPFGGEKVLLFGYADTIGNIVIEPKYEYSESFFDGLAAVKIDGRYGYIDTEDNIVIGCNFDFASNFREGMAVVGRDMKLGYIDKSGEILIPLEYGKASAFINGMAAVGKNGKTGYIDKDNNLLIPHFYDNISFISEGMINVELDGKWGFIDTDGNTLIDFIYDSASPFFDGIAYVGMDGGYGYIRYSGDFVIEPSLEFTDDSYYEVGRLSSSRDYIIAADVESCSYDWEYLSVYSQRIRDYLILFKKNDKIGFMDVFGKIIIEPEYETATSFINGKALVQKNSNYSFIDIGNNTIYGFSSAFRMDAYNGNITTYFNSNSMKSGFVNDVYTAICDSKYDKIYPFFNGFACVMEGESSGLIDTNGKEIIPPIYWNVSPVSQGFVRICAVSRIRK